MPFDKLDKKAREAAEQYNAAYNEEAWSKMEALLDKHMPVVAVEEPVNRKRKFHEKWLFLLLSLVAISFIVLLTKPWKTGLENKVPAENTTIAKQPENKSPNNSYNSLNNSKTIQSLDDANIDPKAGTGNYSINKTRDEIDLASPSNTKARSKAQSIAAVTGINISSSQQGIGKNSTSDDGNNYINEDGIVPTISQLTFLQEGFINQKIDNNFIFNKNIIAEVITGPGVLKIEKIKDTKTKNTAGGKKNNFSNSFSLNVSAGPDVSATNINNVGTIQLLYGAGISYKFAKRWQVRTGFYTVKKIYGAKPSDYNPPAVFWNYYPGLESINADCRVNEIPLIINYTFSENLKHAWFGSVGVSSYFMKRETYDYHSKTPWGYQDKSYTIRGENKHYLSSLRISAGYEKTLNKNISFTAEPYLNLPLSGIGYGKVKLNSAGFLFSLSVKPFAKK